MSDEDLLNIKDAFNKLGSTHLAGANNFKPFTDLEKLKAVFDDIGVDSLRVGNSATTEYLYLEQEDDRIIYLNFKDGKFTHID